MKPFGIPRLGLKVDPHDLAMDSAAVAVTAFGLADAEGTLKLAWRLTRRFQLLARAGYLPGLDAVYRWTFP